ncbi:hypothetical protein FQR65_LT15395 [Abscondita terminalis]|nr:hypothetical protein FQR65_LT15395 [Abscondita terminalis]
MPKTKLKPSKFSPVNKLLSKDFLIDLFCNPQYLNVTSWVLLGVEVILNFYIISKVKYTEIDWVAYMQEVEGFLNGTHDYKFLKGDTGPLVYPAGFVYVYSILYYLTSQGTNVRLAQYIFLVIYLLQMYFVFRVYVMTAKVPPYALIFSTLTSYRIHSIYVLRLFNDPIAVLLFYVSLNLYLNNKWVAGSIFYSLAVSVKMNILLYAPCLLTLFLTNLSITNTILNLFVCGFVQLALGTPFIYTNFASYMHGSFDLGRVFEHKWTSPELRNARLQTSHAYALIPVWMSKCLRRLDSSVKRWTHTEHSRVVKMDRARLDDVLNFPLC